MRVVYTLKRTTLHRSSNGKIKFHYDVFLLCCESCLMAEADGPWNIRATFAVTSLERESNSKIGVKI
jgi:hypothetical protein